MENSESKEPTVQWFYSYSANGWFSPDYNPVIPDDAVEVSESLRTELIAGTREGLVLTEGSGGLPQLSEPAPPSAAELATRERRWRDQQLSLSDPLVTRHRDEIELQSATTLTEADYLALLNYRAALRDWPSESDFPTTARRPRLETEVDIVL